MSKKGEQTKADYINFDTALNTGKRLLNDKKTEKIGLYIIVSIYSGLRTGDVRTLTWDDLREETATIQEQKTKKRRTIQWNQEVKNAVNKIDTGKSGLVFISQKGSVYTPQQINRKLKDAFKSLSKDHNISTHSLRKTFGRRVYEVGNESEKALMYLSEMFNHTSINVTRIYLGLKQEEFNDIYMSL